MTVSTLSGAVVVLVTFLIFSHHLRCGRGLCLTFEAPSGGPLEEQQPALCDLYECFHSASSLSSSPLFSNHNPFVWLLAPLEARCLVLTSWICWCPWLPGEPSGLCSLSRYRLADEDGKGEQTVKMDSFTADRQGTPLCWSMPQLSLTSHEIMAS